MAYGPILVGVGVVFNILRFFAHVYPSLQRLCWVGQQLIRNQERSEHRFSRNRQQNRNRWNRFQEPKPEQCPSVLQRNRPNRKPEPLEPFCAQTVTEPNRPRPPWFAAKTLGLGRGCTSQMLSPCLVATFVLLESNPWTTSNQCRV